MWLPRSSDPFLLVKCTRRAAAGYNRSGHVTAFPPLHLTRDAAPSGHSPGAPWLTLWLLGKGVTYPSSFIIRRVASSWPAILSSSHACPFGIIANAVSTVRLRGLMARCTSGWSALVAAQLSRFRARLEVGALKPRNGKSSARADCGSCSNLSKERRATG